MGTEHSDLPPSLRLAWWGTGWLRGAVGPDDLTAAVLADTVAQVVDGGPLLPALAEARRLGATAIGTAFPAAGDPVGLRGPAAFTAAAIEAEEAVVLLGADLGWAPRTVGRAVEWTSHRAARRPPPDLGEADRGLRTALLEAADGLARLDVAAWNPEVAGELLDLRTGLEVVGAPGTPQRCVDLAGRALHLRAVLDLALADEGGALSLGQLQERRRLLDPLAAAVRRALTAAGSPDGWPPADPLDR